MEFSTLLVYLIVAFLLYQAFLLVRSTLTKYATDLRTTLHELSKTKASLADTARALRARNEDLQSARARAEGLEADAQRAAAAAAAANAEATALRDRLRAADARLVSLQQAAKESLMRWEMATRFGGPPDVSGGDALHLRRRPPDRRPAMMRARGRQWARAGGAAGASVGTDFRGAAIGSGGSGSGSVSGSGVFGYEDGAVGRMAKSPSEAFLLAAEPDLSITDSDDDLFGDEDPFAPKSTAPDGPRRVGTSAYPVIDAVSLPPRRHRTHAAASTSSSSAGSSSPVGGGGAQFAALGRGPRVGGEVTRDTASSQDVAYVAAAVHSEIRRRRRAPDGGTKPVAEGRLAPASGQSSSSSLSSLSVSAMGVGLPHTGASQRTASPDETARGACQALARRGGGRELPSVVELAPSRWPRSRSATQGFRNISGSDDIA